MERQLPTKNDLREELLEKFEQLTKDFHESFEYEVSKNQHDLTLLKENNLKINTKLSQVDMLTNQLEAHIKSSTTLTSKNEAEMKELATKLVPMVEMESGLANLIHQINTNIIPCIVNTRRTALSAVQRLDSMWKYRSNNRHLDPEDPLKYKLNVQVLYEDKSKSDQQNIPSQPEVTQLRGTVPQDSPRGQRFFRNGIPNQEELQKVGYYIQYVAKNQRKDGNGNSRASDPPKTQNKEHRKYQYGSKTDGMEVETRYREPPSFNDATV